MGHMFYSWNRVPVIIGGAVGERANEVAVVEEGKTGVLKPIITYTYHSLLQRPNPDTPDVGVLLLHEKVVVKYL